MPSHMPSSFASAAAGQGTGRDRESRTGRGDGRGSGDWPRRESRTNGFMPLNSRRTSSTPFASAQDSAHMSSEPESSTQQSVSSLVYEHSTDNRYGRDQILAVLKAHQESGVASKDVSHLYVNNWNPEQTNGANGRSGWGRTADTRDTHGPEVCWDAEGTIEPMAFREMDEAERLLFTTDVNSPIKPQSMNKDPNAQGGANGRKGSVSHGQGSNSFALSSPVSNRPSTRRQMTSDSITGLPSPSTGRFDRDSFFNRKFGDSKDVSEGSEDTKSSLPFGGLMRSNTAGSVLGNGPASPWGPSGAAMSPMGNFGSFAIGGSSANPPTPIDKRSGFGSIRGESRLTHLMPKESSEDMSARAADRPWRPRQRTDTDPFGDDPPAGSAALKGGRDASPPPSQRKGPGADTPIRGTSSDFGMSDAANRDDQRGLSHQTPHHQHDENEPLSPSETNPYRSPPEDKHERDEGSYDGDSNHPSRLQGLAGLSDLAAAPPFGLQRGFTNAPFEGSDRSQTSSAAGTRAFPPIGGLSSLSNLGGIGGWPTSAGIATPDRENRPGFPAPFGSSIFGSMGDLQSPSLGGGGLGGVFGAGANLSGTNTAGRGSKLGSLFPAAMQAQMQSTDNEHTADGSDGRQSSGFGAIGRHNFPTRDTDSPVRGGRPLEDIFASPDVPRMPAPWSSADNPQGQTSTSFGPGVTSQPNNYQQAQNPSDSASNQLPTAQQKTMVMPDRMRWVYLDPQGQTQGPFSGLEMHDWYKANFFSPDLSVKKLEDTDFEPLGQLIRRIGNSREPFLVPQIGIPHGSASNSAGGPFASSSVASGNGAQPGSVQPPFAGAFPSFGTTLTAEQQNNLERRKQEEQFLMARQREFLAQQQVNMKHVQQMGGVPGALHHHSSAHSLHSQPSFGSITSPIGMPQQPPISGNPGWMDGSRPPQPPAPAAMPQDFFREDNLANLSIQDRQQPFGAPGQQPSHAQQIAAIFGHSQAPQIDQNDPNDPQGFKARLRQFEQLREEHDQEAAADASANASNEPIGPPRQVARQQHEEPKESEAEQAVPEQTEPEALSLTQQVQKAASSQQSPISAPQPESPWAKVNNKIPMPFPPPQSSTPLPAPTAQRGRTNLPEALNVETRSRSETPEMSGSATATLAPWAKEQSEGLKGPSLKEIQEAEAKKAARDEEIAAAQRRLAHEQEMRLLSSQPAVPAPGLPTSSTWGNSASPATPTNAGSAWANPGTSNVSAASKAAASKKTLADIQREEESKKQKLAAVAAASQPASGSANKRYADLASKPTASVPTTGSAWSTVGAGGKVKVPTGPAAAPPALRSTSSAVLPTASAARPTRPAATVRSVTTSGAASTNAAHTEFTKWAKATLSKGLDSSINVDDFLRMLADCPPEASIIAECVYGASQLMDGRHFAEEYLRRKKQADKGIVEAASNSGEKSSGGWSEVAKKGPPKEEPASAFKVVNKKKAKK